MPDQSNMSPFPQQPVAVDVDEVVTAMVTSDPELSYYLHRETGAVALVNAETRADLEEIYTALGGDADLPEASVAAAIRQRALPDWRHKALLEADQVERGLGTRYVVVPREQPQEAYRAMEEFIGTVDDARLRERLAEAIEGRGAFGRFRRVLSAHEEERARWGAFTDARLREQVVAWLAEEGIGARP